MSRNHHGLLVGLLMLLAPLAAGASASADPYPSTIVVTNAAARAAATAQTTIVYPNDARTLRIDVALGDAVPIWSVVVIVHVRSPIAAVVEAGDGACEQPTDPRSGSGDWMVCRFFDPPPGSAITATFTLLRPVGIVTNPISEACMAMLHVGTPISVAVNGAPMIDQATIWSPYRPGYCTYLPTLAQ